MASEEQDTERLERKFLESERPHVLMITNHGVHEWRMALGSPDTGGQNVFVNLFTEALDELGYKVTIINRGGYEHPTTGEWHGGRRYKGPYQRIVYIEDGEHCFIRKEDMNDQIPRLVDSLQEVVEHDGLAIALIVSHYWDGAKIGVRLNKRLSRPARHIWVPHSLGAIKKRNVDPQDWDELRIEERIAEEMALLPELDGVAATSGRLRESLLTDYQYSGDPLWLPPGVNPKRYFPREVDESNPLWEFLASHSALDAKDIQRSKIITEVSRTDATKRKQEVVKAFNAVARDHPDAFLVLTLDQHRREIAGQVEQLIHDGGMAGRVATVGSIWQWLPMLYAATYVYFTPSVMEGFGMSIQEAAASRVPAVASDLVPFATEYLLGKKVETIPIEGRPGSIKQGEGCLIVPADQTDGFAKALDRLLADEALRDRMAEAAYRITIPEFSWRNLVRSFLGKIGLEATS